MSQVAKAARPRRLPAWFAAVIVALGVAAGVIWYGWLWFTTPAPPSVPLDGAEPAVVQAIETARKQVRQNGRSAVAWGQLGKVLRAHAYLEASDACFAWAERLDPKEPRWPYYQGLTRAATDPEAALPFLRRAVELADRYDRGNDEPRLRLAETLLQAGTADEAEAQLDQVLSWNPGSPRVHYDLGVLTVARGEDATAERHFTASAVSPYARRKSCSALAAIRLRRGDEAGAAEYNRRAAAPPEDWPWDDAYIEECTRLEVGRISRFERTERLMAEGRPEEALPILLTLAEDASDARAQIATGMALYKLGRNEEAERYFRMAVGLKEEQAEANYWLAVVLYTEGTRAKYGEAVACADKALALKPDHALAHFYRGLALNGLGRRKEAITAFRQAVLCHPELVDPHWELANALAEEGREDEAKPEWRRVAELAPDADPRRGRALARIGGAH
jgi:tetratricopeptide (TPR) repeat protein